MQLTLLAEGDNVTDSRQGFLGATPMAMVELVLSTRRGLWQALPSAWQHGYTVPHSDL